MNNNDIKLIHGDCLVEMQSIADKSIDCILTDLPYEQTARNDWDNTIPFDLLWQQYNRIIKDNGAIILFANGMFTADLMNSQRDLWRYNLIWEKTQPTGHLNAHRMPLRCHEDICIFYKSLPTYNPQKLYNQPRKVSSAQSKINGKMTLNYNTYNLTSYDSTERFPTSILTFSKDVQKSALHPTQKPVALLEYLIKTYTNKNDTVLDSCMGSGSTGVACINTHRKFIGIELTDEYYKIATDRLNQAIKENDMRLF